MLDSQDEYQYNSSDPDNRCGSLYGIAKTTVYKIFFVLVVKEVFILSHEYNIMKVH